MSCFFDTNILIYAIDNRHVTKQQRAINLLGQHFGKNSGIISTQVLQEFYSVATGRLKLTSTDALRMVQNYMQLRVVQLTPAVIWTAMNRHGAGGFSFWDALIIEAALHVNTKILYSEDMQDGMSISGMTIRNPFTEV